MKMETTKEVLLSVIVEKKLNSEFDFRYNEVSNEVEYKRKEALEFKPVNENDFHRWLQHKNINFPIANLIVLFRSNFVSTYNPFEKYFTELPEWDGIDRISQLCGFIKAKDQGRLNQHFKKMLVRCVKCSLGIKFNKQAFILIGGQNGGKTTFFRWLCPDKLKKYYTENIATDKDSLIGLSENFIINLDELESLYKTELNKLKSMMSSEMIKVRHPYARRASVSRRRANFFGSTNKDEFLADETGAVRWLCFEIYGIVWGYETQIDCNQIWAQAYSLCKSDFACELTPEEIAENDAINSVYQVRTIELELVQKYFEPAKKGEPSAQAMATTDILIKLKTVEESVSLNLINLGKALRVAGHKAVSAKIQGVNNSRKVYWVRFIHREPTTLRLGIN